MKARALLFGVVAGAGAGLAARALLSGAPALAWFVDHVSAPIGQIFLRLLFMLVIPLVVAALVVGIAAMEPRQLGRLGARTLAYTVTVSTIAAALGLLLVNLVRPGARGVGALAPAAGTAATAAPAGGTPGVAEFIVGMVPDNPIKAAAAGDMLGVIVFALILGLGLAVTRTPGAERLREFFAGLYDVMMTCLRGVLFLAPVGIGALLFTMTVRFGGALFGPVAAYVAVAVGGLALHLFVVYGLILRFVARRSPRAFFRGARLAIVTAFSTASSAATLPAALKVAEEELGLPREQSRFVLTVGATMNQNGTALFEGVTVLFLAQLYGVPMGLPQQAAVMGIAVLSGIGTAGVPAASMPVIAMILGLFKIPVEGIALVMGVDRLLDMCRTTVNVTGDLVAAAVVTRADNADATPMQIR